MMSTLTAITFPAWAQVSEKRIAHIERVTELLADWAIAMQLPLYEATLFVDAGRLHDTLRDAPEAELRAITGDHQSPVGLLHGPAAATLLERDNESRSALLDAVRYHTVGSANWGAVGKALYMADYLESGRKFSRSDRQFLSALVPRAFDSIFRQVVRLRLEWSIREGYPIFPETVALWNRLQ
jgi:2-amino-4-hydroxy-6-hydroxymethyldihydropteridine diphosphokinase